MFRLLAATLALTVPTVAAAQTPVVYSRAQALAASARLCARGCTITPQPRLIRADLPARVRPSAAPADSRSMEALARRQLDALVATID